MADIGLPVININKSRDEILIVYFDGFIKNASQGVLNTMIEDYDTWLDKYPNLEGTEKMSNDVIYSATMLFRPLDLLYSLCDGRLSIDEMTEDLNKIEKDIDWNKCDVTTFEYGLYNLLNEGFVKKCYIFKDTDFTEAEVEFIKRKYNDVLSKIEFASGGLITLKEYNIYFFNRP